MDLSVSNSSAPTKKKSIDIFLFFHMLKLAGLWGRWLHFLAFVYKACKFIKGGGVHVSGKVCSVKSNVKKTVMGINETHIRYFLKSKETCRSFLRSSSSEQASENEDKTGSWVKLNNEFTSHWWIAALWAWLVYFQYISYSLQTCSWDNTITSCVAFRASIMWTFGHVLFRISHSHALDVKVSQYLGKYLVLWHWVWERQRGDFEDQVAGFWVTIASFSHDLPV